MSERPSDRPTAGDGEHVGISDAALRRLLIWFGALLGAALVAVAVTAVVRTAFDLDERQLNPAEVGFLQDMTVHHQQALEIASAYLSHSPDGEAATYAREVQRSQQIEIGGMARMLDDVDAPHVNPSGTAMEWMGMPAPAAQMPGMQTPTAIVELAAASGSTADRMFFDLMIAHHAGGVHMAEGVLPFADDDEVISLAKSVARNQQIESIEYQQAIDRLGL